MTRAEKLRIWSRINWERTDTEIASVLGCRNVLVRYWRLRLNKPDSPRKFSRAKRRLYTYLDLDWRHTDAHLARQTGLCREYMRQVRKRLHMPKAMCPPLEETA